MVFNYSGGVAGIFPAWVCTIFYILLPRSSSTAPRFFQTHMHAPCVQVALPLLFKLNFLNTFFHVIMILSISKHQTSRYS